MLSTAPILALNHLLAGAAWARKRLLPFAGRRARIELAPVSLILEVTPEGYFAAGAEGEVEVSFTLPPGTPVLALRGVNAVVREAHVNGPADFADALGSVLRNLKWDAEEDMSKLVGDMAAHRLAGLARGVAEWQRNAATHAAENVVEYLREEQGILPHKDGLALWSAEVSRLQTDLARLEARVKALPQGKAIG
jgi:ubiquinone biosynthesis protein UbiJ